MVDPAPTQNHPTRRFIGLVLLSIGVLWLVLTGLCTAGALVTVVAGGNLSDITLVLLFAVPSAVLGGAIYFGGRLLRPRR